MKQSNAKIAICRMKIYQNTRNRVLANHFHIDQKKVSLVFWIGCIYHYVSSNSGNIKYLHTNLTFSSILKILVINQTSKFGLTHHWPWPRKTSCMVGCLTGWTYCTKPSQVFLRIQLARPSLNLKARLDQSLHHLLMQIVVWDILMNLLVWCFDSNLRMVFCRQKSHSGLCKYWFYKNNDSRKVHCNICDKAFVLFGQFLSSKSNILISCPSMLQALWIMKNRSLFITS